MSVAHTYRCDGEDCEVHVQSCDPPPRAEFLRVLANEGHDEPVTFDFCGWGCLTRFAFRQPSPETIPYGPPGLDGM